MQTQQCIALVFLGLLAAGEIGVSLLADGIEADKCLFGISLCFLQDIATAKTVKT